MNRKGRSRCIIVGARLFRKETCNTKTERKKEERESERKKGKNKGDYETLKSTGNT